MAEFTSTQILHAVADAIREHDFPAVESLLILLAGQDPKLASDAYDTIKLGVDLAALIDGSPDA